MTRPLKHDASHSPEPRHGRRGWENLSTSSSQLWGESSESRISPTSPWRRHSFTGKNKMLPEFFRFRFFIPIRIRQLWLGSGLRITSAAEQEEGDKHDPGPFKMLAMVPALWWHNCSCSSLLGKIRLRVNLGQSTDLFSCFGAKEIRGTVRFFEEKMRDRKIPYQKMSGYWGKKAACEIEIVAVQHETAPRCNTTVFVCWWTAVKVLQESKSTVRRLKYCRKVKVL